VATLSLHSLLELRSCLTNGAILLDFPGEDINAIVDCLLDNVIHLKYLDESKRDLVRNALLLKHVHQHEKEFQKQLNRKNKSNSDFSKKSSHADDMHHMANQQQANLLNTTTNEGNIINNNSASKAIFDTTGAQLNKTDSKAKVNIKY